MLPPASVACGLTAARLWRCDGLPRWGHDEPLELLVPGRSGRLRLAGTMLHTGSATVGTDYPDGVPATSLARTLIDLAGRLTLAEAVGVVGAALHRAPTIAGEIAAERERGLPPRRARQVSDVLRFAGDRSESILESRARIVFADARLPPPK